MAALKKMDKPEVFDLCIIGAGKFGSAAARHASANPCIKVCLVGPAAPQACEFPELGFNYDEGRITRILDEAPACEKLSHHSIERYRDLERLSGIKFYEPVGCLFTGPRNGRFICSLKEGGEMCKVDLLEMAGTDQVFQSRFPYLRLSDDEYALLDYAGGGHISPGNLVAAQKKLARAQGCHIVEAVVCGTETQSDGIHVVKTESKGEIRARRLLIATGGFLNLRQVDVLPPLLLQRRKETVVLLNLREEEAFRLRAMPSMLSVRGNSTGAYILPPIKHQDGRWYLKVGKVKLQEEDDELTTLEQVREWYRSSGEDMDTYVQLASDLIPGLRFSSVSKRTCATCNTPTGLPYIYRVSATVAVAVGGNGKAAKFSDEVGRIAAHLSLTGRWDSELRPGLFEAIFQ